MLRSGWNSSWSLLARRHDRRLRTYGVFCPFAFCTRYSTCPSRRPGSCNLHWPPQARSHWRQCAPCCTEVHTSAVVLPRSDHRDPRPRPRLRASRTGHHQPRPPRPITTTASVGSARSHLHPPDAGTDDRGGPRLTATPLTTCGGTENHGQISRHVASQERRQLEGSTIKSAADEGDMGAAGQEALPPTHRSYRQHTIPLARHPRLCV